MTIFEYRAANAETGDELTLRIGAQTEREAAGKAQAMGYVLGSLQRVAASPDPTPTISREADT